VAGAGRLFGLDQHGLGGGLHGGAGGHLGGEGALGYATGDARPQALPIRGEAGHVVPAVDLVGLGGVDRGDLDHELFVLVVDLAGDHIADGSEPELTLLDDGDPPLLGGVTFGQRGAARHKHGDDDQKKDLVHRTLSAHIAHGFSTFSLDNPTDAEAGRTKDNTTI